MLEFILKAIAVLVVLFVAGAAIHGTIDRFHAYQLEGDRLGVVVSVVFGAVLFLIAVALVFAIAVP